MNLTENIFNPLVSIVVITYNSSKYVLETLVSAKAQTYRNIELIVSDDCSTDNTIEICRKWIEENKNRFVRTELITVEKNTGIASNCNRGLGQAKGEWIKYIAGDDIILNNGISLLIEFQNKHDHASLIHGRVIYIDSLGNEIQTIPSKNKLLYPTFDEEFQSNKIYSPSAIFLKSDLDMVGGFSVQFKIEDIYLFLKLLSIGKLAFYLDKVIAKYRIHNNNLSSDNFQMLNEHLKILSEYKEKRGFIYNYYLFCRNVLLFNLIQFKNPSRSIRLIIQRNPLIFFSVLDVIFWYRLIKGKVKKYINSIE